MDLIKRFKRQKSVGKKEKGAGNVEDPSFKTAHGLEKPCDLNLNSKQQKNGKSLRKSIRNSFRKRKQSYQSNSCDDILKSDPNPTQGASRDTLRLPKNTNRWSYSPDHTAANFDPSILHNPSLFRRHTEGRLQVENLISPGRFDRNHVPEKNFMSSFIAPPTEQQTRTQKATSVGDVAVTSDEIPYDAAGPYISSSQPQLHQNRSSQHSAFEEFPRPQTDSDIPTSGGYLIPTKLAEREPHSTLYEHAAESALNRMRQLENDEAYHKYYTGNGFSEDLPPAPSDQMNDYQDVEERGKGETLGDDLSWGSNEFESDSEEDSLPYDNDMLEEGLRKNKFFKRNRELGKEFTEGMKKLKFLQKKNVLGKKNSKTEHDDEVSTFIDVRFSKERHPGPHLKPPPQSLLPYQSRRRNIVETIISSESSYIDSLERLEISYKKSLLDSRPAILSGELVEKIFYKVADILQCHQLFQIALASAVNDWDEHEKIGDTFVASFSKCMVLECYSSYINNFTTAMELVRKTCKQKPQFLAFLRERQNESQNRLNLYGLMLKPVQRFPQFIMLVQDLLKHTPSDHEDRLPLQLALTELETLAENLNQRRADDEERSELVQLLESSNIKLMSNATKDGRTRRLLRQGFVRELTYADDGSVEKDRECLLVLTNDMLLSCSCANRRQQPRSGISTFRDLYKLKWCTNLDILTVYDGQNAAVSTEQTKVISDIAILKSICQMIENLHFPQPGLSTEQLKSSIASLEGRISQPETNNHLSSDTSFTIVFPQKSGDSKRTLVMADAQLCNEWLEGILNAKLANEQKNLHCWFSADGSDAEYLWRPPLFLESVKCLDNNRALQVQCAYAFMPATHITLLWLACSASTVVAIVNVYRIVDEKTEKVHAMQVESSVQCMEHWDPCHDSASVWLGMECGSLIEFSTESPFSKLCEVTMPTMSTVMIMKAFEKNLYVGLLDGSLLMYTRPDGHKGLVHVQSITVGSGPLNCLSPLDGKLWGASGNDIVTVNLEDFKMESIRTIQAEESMTVSHVVQVGSGFWVAFCDTCSLHLYHLDSLKLLQDVNLSRAIRDFFQGLGWQSRVNEYCSITTMWSSYWQLLVGTSNGLILTMPLPKLSGSVPKITGPCRICYHMLNGPVNFLCAPPMPPRKPKESSSESIPAKVDEEEEIPPEVPERSPVKPTGGIFSHKRTSSEGLLNMTDISPASSFNRPKKRFSSVEPYSNRSSVDKFPKFTIPPALPPKPNTPKKDEVVTEELLEDEFVFSKTEVEKMSSPTRTIERPWHGGRARNFPVVLACGDGYRYVQDFDGNSADTSHKATTILCWKIVL